MENQERDFKGIWIPKDIWLDDRLNALEKCILMEIDSLDGENGCFAGNEYLAQFCQCSITKISTAISKLVEMGYLEVQSFDGRQRILKSSLSKNESQPFKKCKSDVQKMKDSKIDYNKNIDKEKNTRRILKESKRFIPPSVQEVQAYVDEKGYTVDAERFVDYYTSKGWVVGKSPMKDWQAAVRTWERGYKQRDEHDEPWRQQYSEEDLKRYDR